MAEKKENWLYETTLSQIEMFYINKLLIRHKAFIKLTGAAKQILLELYMRLKVNSTGKGKNQRFFAENNGELKLTYKSIHKQFGYSTATISKAIDQLVAKGFIEIAVLGCGVKRQSHKIALITNWQEYGTDNFKAGKGKSNVPINGGFKKRKNLETTSETKAGITLETKAVQGKKIQKIA
jgi:DNA-binding MarR family transcriptional regulator